MEISDIKYMLPTMGSLHLHGLNQRICSFSFSKGLVRILSKSWKIVVLGCSLEDLRLSFFEN